MAILDEVPGIKVTVQVDGQDLTEFDDPHAADSDFKVDYECPVVSKYIESIEDAEFSIKLAIDHDVYAWGRRFRSRCLIGHAEIDGSWIDSPIIHAGDEDQVIDGLRSYSEASKEWYLRKLKFSMTSQGVAPPPLTYVGS